MAKININFNNTNYQIDESSLSTASSALRQHLSTTMAGSGATINFGGQSYNIDATKLSAAKNEFVAHLGAIAGSGAKVVVDGVEYGVDSTKLTNAVSDIEAVLAGTGEERLGGDGSEFYTLAPAALSFRSTAPLNELQEIQINGVTVDPSNYTLEEGSTIVTFPIEYLKTLDVGNYEVNVVSDSKTVKGDFNVKAPELNNYGFYYNQPYSANLPMFGGDTAFFVREDGTFDIITVGKNLTTSTYTVDGNNIVAIVPPLGTVNCTISTDGTSIYCNEVATNFELNGSTAIIADEDYVYEYKEDLGGYEVQCIDKTKAEYGAIKTGINGIDTVKLADGMFYNISGNSYFRVAPKIPDSVTIIGKNAFRGCVKMHSIVLPNHLDLIDVCAFYNTPVLIDFTIPSSVTSIQEEAFCGSNLDDLYEIPYVTTIGPAAFCSTNIRNIVLANGITSISDRMFDNCRYLGSITIPVSVTNIGKSAFWCSEGLMEIIYGGTMSQWTAIEKGEDWDYHTGSAWVGNVRSYRHYLVKCSDGTVDADGKMIEV